MNFLFEFLEFLDEFLKKFDIFFKFIQILVYLQFYDQNNQQNPNSSRPHPIHQIIQFHLST
jgi:hypothetical protein